MSQPGMPDLEKSAFQQMVERDLMEVFVNPVEFATEHSIEGKRVMLVEEIQGEKEGDGGYRQAQWMKSDADRMFFMAEGERLRVGLDVFRAEQRILYDNAYMTVVSAELDDGMWCVTLLGAIGR